MGSELLSEAMAMDLLLEPRAERHEARHEFRFAEITGEVGGLGLVGFLSLCNLNIFKLNEYFELRVGTFILFAWLFYSLAFRWHTTDLQVQRRALITGKLDCGVWSGLKLVGFGPLATKAAKDVCLLNS